MAHDSADESPKRHIFVDVETTGFTPGKNITLELGLSVTDLDLNVIAEKSWVIRPVDKAAFDDLSPWILDTHGKNGLLDECKSDSAISPAHVAWEALDFLMKLDFEPQKMPMSGSSVGFDKSFIAADLPMLGDFFHHRVIDNSTIKEMCRRYNKPVYDKLPDFETDHRVKTCLKGTRSEMKFYVDNFIFDAR